MTEQVKISGIRCYAGEWLICDLVCNGKPWMVRHGRLYPRDEGEVDWLDWLFDSPEAEQTEFSIAPDGENVEWPKLGHAISAHEFLNGHPPSFRYGWKPRTLVTEASRDQLIDCWRNAELWRLTDLRSDGSCAQKAQTKGGTKSDIAGVFNWSFESPTRFHVDHQLAEPIEVNQSSLELMSDLIIDRNLEAITKMSCSYEIMLFDGRVMELLETWTNGLVAGGPKPVWWQRWKRPKDWQGK